VSRTVTNVGSVNAYYTSNFAIGLQVVFRWERLQSSW